MNTGALDITQQSLCDAGVLVFIEVGADEQAILQMLEERLFILLRDLPAFMQTMYRLDIAEGPVLEALQHPQPARPLARMVFRRQWRKAIARRNTPPVPPEAEEDLLL